MFGGGKNGTGLDVDAGDDVTGDVNADSKASAPKKSFEVLLNTDVEDADVADVLDVLDAFDDDDANGAKGSDPNGSEVNASFVVFCFSVCSLNFRLENGSNESSRLSEVVEVEPANGANGSCEAADVGGHADANGSLADGAGAVVADADIPPRRLKGSCPPKVVGFAEPKAVVTGAVNGSSLS